MGLSTLEKMKLAQKQNRAALKRARQPVRKDSVERIKQHRRALRAAWGERMGPYQSGNPANGFGSFLKDVHTKCVTGEWPKGLQDFDKEYREFRGKTLSEFRGKAFPSAINESIMSDGGVFVPPQFANELLMRVYENDLLSRVRVFNQLTSNVLNIPAIDETSRADGSRFGGVTSYMRQEGPPSAVTASRPKENYLSLKVETLYVFVKTTTEMLEDYPVLETFLGDVVAQEFGFRCTDYIVNGDGVAKPEGMLTSPSKLSVSANAGQSAAAGTGLVADNVFDMWQRLWVGCRKNAVWLISNRCWSPLLQMTVGNIPIFLPQHTANGAPYPTLLGRPVIETEVNPDLGTEGDIMLVDPSSYLWASKGDMKSFSSMHVYFDTGLHAFRFEMRIDGKSWWRSKLTQKYGTTNTVSNIVTLAARA